jgi:hypothetical protein
MGNYSYLPQFLIPTAATMLPVNITEYKRHFANVLISARFLKLLSVQSFYFSGNLYNFMPIFTTLSRYTGVVQVDAWRS